MKMFKHAAAVAPAALGLVLAAIPVSAQSLAVDFSAETVGAEPRAFASVVGIWRIEAEGDKKVLAVDGRQWKEGQASTGLADKARAIYGERYAEFLDNVQAFAYYPYAVARNVPDFREGEIAVRFKAISGRIDQGAGILFNLKPNGDYLALRANPLENNLVLWKFEKGKRSSVKFVRNTPTSSGQWHELQIRIVGTKVEGYLDGKLLLEDVLPQPVSGRIGLWSKADSYVRFADYTVRAQR
ncbi:MAG TPA: LamG domain-containing protein [Stellaceae bacterium]|nr:LamG domain-containing protein [Stellaceae bacterium]